MFLPLRVASGFCFRVVRTAAEHCNVENNCGLEMAVL